MTPEDRAALRALIAEAAPLPWRRERLDDGAYSIEPNVVWLGHLGSDIHTSDARLIVAAVNALPALLSALEEAEDKAWQQQRLKEDAGLSLALTENALRTAESESAALRARLEEVEADRDHFRNGQEQSQALNLMALDDKLSVQRSAEEVIAALRAQVETLTREARDLRSRGSADAEWMAQAMKSIEGLTVTVPDFTGHPVVDVVRSLRAQVEGMRSYLRQIVASESDVIGLKALARAALARWDGERSGER